MNRTLPERIFICGFMGAGKTTAGKMLARKLEMSFHDLDEYIEKQDGRSVSEIFSTEGEAGFRQKERIALLKIIREEKGVVALGGGALQNQHLVDHVKVNGLLVFIETPLNEILERIMEQEHRPLLLDENGTMKPESVLREELQVLYEQRFRFYEQAEITIKSEEYASREELVAHLIKKIHYHVAIH